MSYPGPTRQTDRRQTGKQSDRNRPPIPYHRRPNEVLELSFPKLLTFVKSTEPLSRNRDPNTTQNEHVHTICGRPEIGDDVISGHKVKSIEGYVLVNFKVLKLLAQVVSDITKLLRDGGHRR